MPDNAVTPQPGSSPAASGKDYVRTYLDTIEAKLERIYAEQRDMIRRCAELHLDHIR
jgi:hypothetical protein